MIGNAIAEYFVDFRVRGFEGFAEGMSKARTLAQGLGGSLDRLARAATWDALIGRFAALVSINQRFAGTAGMGAWVEQIARGDGVMRRTRTWLPMWDGFAATMKA